MPKVRPPRALRRFPARARPRQHRACRPRAFFRGRRHSPDLAHSELAADSVLAFPAFTSPQAKGKVRLRPRARAPCGAHDAGMTLLTPRPCSACREARTVDEARTRTRRTSASSSSRRTVRVRPHHCPLTPNSFCADRNPPLAPPTEYAQVLKMLGNGRVEAMCFDGEKRLAHIRGKMRKKVSLRTGAGGWVRGSARAGGVASLRRISRSGQRQEVHMGGQASAGSSRRPVVRRSVGAPTRGR